ncbi:hypothetical protein BDB00DRAFT_427564 [Zychaea mexicana]|uniref:uncharacterized protein n=1 Tax=Zychaea mexicana TaxID=64656 RepID=UPI0022FE7DEC|nr:uncharacterized protein BDB00DRAFT_427564 [Zychaea mexicana]KAI9492666.1 hypothetical protein BDB00DRAFT_427564 [Zychaea mexicana]
MRRQLVDIIATEPSPAFTYSHPSVYMRGLVAWLLDEDARNRPSAQDVILEIDALVKSNLPYFMEIFQWQSWQAHYQKATRQRPLLNRHAKVFDQVSSDLNTSPTLGLAQAEVPGPALDLWLK